MTAPTIHKTFKYKLKPTAAQAAEFERVLVLCRHLYNAALEQRRTAYRQRGISLTRFAQLAEIKHIRAEMPEYATVASHVLQNVLVRVDRAYQAFFRRLSAGEKVGYPRFKGQNQYNSFTYPEIATGNGRSHGTYLDNGYVVLSRIGRVAVRWSRPLEGTPKTVTVSREADGWYVCFSCANVAVVPLPITGVETGVDLGIEAFATLANGDRIDNPRYYRVAEPAIRRAQRRLKRRKNGSNRRRKARKLLATAYRKVKRQRADFHYKTALALVRQYDVIYHEALQPEDMLRSPKPIPDGKGHYQRNGSAAKSGLNKAIGDAGWGLFLSILSYKAASAGKRAIAIPPHHTSQACSGCGIVVPKPLKQRWHSCHECGIEIHRDHNAALNILARGQEQSRLGQSRQALTQAGTPYVA